MVIGNVGRYGLHQLSVNVAFKCIALVNDNQMYPVVPEHAYFVENEFQIALIRTCVNKSGITVFSYFKTDNAKPVGSHSVAYDNAACFRNVFGKKEGAFKRVGKGGSRKDL